MSGRLGNGYLWNALHIDALAGLWWKAVVTGRRHFIQCCARFSSCGRVPQPARRGGMTGN
ncbi:hypothetical protein [Dyella humicola]|uniref:hypothetical protein n=1 Tax=Dyella humicola TaxID=2992126 RepID=UPI00224F2157|nr:hypothetical protein [Dyella humicola]